MALKLGPGVSQGFTVDWNMWDATTACVHVICGPIIPAVVANDSIQLRIQLAMIIIIIVIQMVNHHFVCPHVLWWFMFTRGIITTALLRLQSMVLSCEG